MRINGLHELEEGKAEELPWLKREAGVTAKSQRMSCPGIKLVPRNRLAQALDRYPTIVADVEAQLGTNRMLAQALHSYPNYLHVALVSALETIATKLKPGDAARTLTLAARMLSRAMQKEEDVHTLKNHAEKLGAIASRLEPAEATPILMDAASVLVQAFHSNGDPADRAELADGLGAVAGQLDNTKGSRFIQPTIRVFVQALEKEWDPTARQIFALGLAALSKTNSPEQQRRLFHPAVKPLMEALAKSNDPNNTFLLAKGLAAVAVHQEPGEAARLLRQAANSLIHLLDESWTARTESSEAQLAQADVHQALAQELAAVVLRLESAAWSRFDVDAEDQQKTAFAARLDLTEATRLRSDATHLLARLLANNSNSDFRQDLARELAGIAVGLEGREIDSPLHQAAKVLIRTLEVEKDADTVRVLAGALADVAPRLGGSERARMLGQAVQLLTRALRTARDANTVQHLAEGLAGVTSRLESGEAVEDLSISATGLNHALTNARNPFERWGAAEALNILLPRLEPKEAVRLSAQTALALADSLEASSTWLPWTATETLRVSRKLSSYERASICIPAIKRMTSGARKTTGWKRCNLEWGVAILLTALNHDIAARYSQELAFELCSGRDMNYWEELEDGTTYDRVGVFDALLTNLTQPEENRRVIAFGTALGLSCVQPIAVLPALPPASEPFPCYLSTQDLVELLKMPTCFGKARQVVLRHLGNRYHRTFATPWDFVRCAKEHHLDLDFTTPPKRPARP